MGRLVLLRRRRDLVHVLDGIEVKNGARIEVRLPNGIWATGRLSWDGDAYEAPTLGVEVGDSVATIHLPPDAELRWPRGARRAQPMSAR